MVFLCLRNSAIHPPKSIRRLLFLMSWIQGSWRRELRLFLGHCRLLSLILGLGSMFSCVVMFLNRVNDPKSTSLRPAILLCSTVLISLPKEWSGDRGSYQFWLHRIQRPEWNTFYFLICKLSDRFIFIISFDDVKGIGQRLAPIVDLSWSNIAGAEYSRYFIGCDHFFVLGRYFWAPEGDMEVAYYEGELTHLLFFSHVDIPINNKYGYFNMLKKQSILFLIFIVLACKPAIQNSGKKHNLLFNTKNKQIIKFDAFPKDKVLYNYPRWNYYLLCYLIHRITDHNPATSFK